MTFRPEKTSNNSSHNFTVQPQSIAPTKIAFIGTGGTASASEIVINGFVPYLHANAALIGTNTYGKPVGQIALDKSACDDRLRVIAFAIAECRRGRALIMTASRRSSRRVARRATTSPSRSATRAKPRPARRSISSKARRAAKITANAGLGTQIDPGDAARADRPRPGEHGAARDAGIVLTRRRRHSGGMSDDIQPAIPAATLVLIRDRAGEPPDLLMVERAKAMVFAGGMLVFPGGRIDPGDYALAAKLGLDPDDGPARIAAIRETIEEAGVPVGLTPAPDADTLAAIRTGLHAGEAFGALLDAHGLTLDLDALTYFARWLPAHAHMRIFDTRFYLAAWPDGAAEPVVDDTENVRLALGERGAGAGRLRRRPRKGDLPHPPQPRTPRAVPRSRARRRRRAGAPAAHDHAVCGGARRRPAPLHPRRPRLSGDRRKTDRRAQGMRRRRRRRVITVALVVLPLVALAILHFRGRPQDLPWTSLDLAEPVGLFTGSKLAALGQDYPRCRALLDRAGVHYARLAPISVGQCGYGDAVRLDPGGSRTIGFDPAKPGMACPVAAALAMWEWNVVQPAALRRFGSRVVTDRAFRHL